MKKRILFTSVHPAPYIDMVIRSLSVENLVTVLYNRQTDNYKQWKAFQGEKGECFSDLSIRSFVKLVYRNDFIIVGGWASWDCIKLILMGKLLFKRIAVFSDCPRIPDRKSWQYYFKRYILFPMIDYLYCATDSTIQLYKDHYRVNARKLRFFPYAINFPNKTENDRIQKQRIASLQNGEPLRLLITNNFYERKGYSVILKAFQQLAEIGILDKYQITIAGVGEEADYYKSELSKLSSSIRFLGWLEVDDYCKCMDETDIYLHASLYEPFGIPPLDAMARGKLLIVSDGVQSTLSLISNGVNGYIYPSSSAETLTKILKKIDKQRIYEIGKIGEKAVNKKYAYKIYSETLNDCLSNIIKQND